MSVKIKNMINDFDYVKLCLYTFCVNTFFNSTKVC